jgi:predicted nucleic acid-binding protein
MVILDTNIIIDHLRQKSRGDTILMKMAKSYRKDQLAISILSIQELYEGRSTKNKRKEEYMLATIGSLKFLKYDLEVAQKAGEIARDLKKPIEFVDSAIAATAIIHNSSLLTLNQKHYANIKGINLETIPK